jgi:universal stress protein E
MQKFRNLLVGIDVDAAGQLAAGSKPALQQALWLATRHAARVTLVHVIAVPEAVGEVLGLQPQSAVSARQRQVNELLTSLVETARQQGINAEGRVLFGVDWQEIIALVQQEGHDLVLAGTRGRSMAGRTLFGSTCNRLLRYCPCPVWSIRNEAVIALRAVLVAHDLGTSGSAALQLGAAIAELQLAELHVLHALELPEDQYFLASVTADEIAAREQAAHQELRAAITALGGNVPATVTVCTGNAHAAILDYLQRHPVDLLCMGTVARSGLRGLLTGNTAESVLPWIDCSLLAVKPDNFVSPALRSTTNLTTARTARRTS